MGLYRAGFGVVGVDIRPQPRYPFRFVQADAMRPPFDLSAFDFVWASPPCQGYSALRCLPWLRDREYPLLIEPVREMLRAAPAWCIENVERAPLRGIVLCGQMFGLPVYRHRKFETSFPIPEPFHPRHRHVIGHGRRVNDRRKGTLNAGSGKGAWGCAGGVITVAGGQFRKADGARALDIDWMTTAELSQAIPPDYAEFIGRYAMSAIRGSAAT